VNAVIESWEFMKDREFHDQLRDCKFLAKILAATKYLSK
jgi:hypothetical protein